MTPNEIEWYNGWQRVIQWLTTGGTASDSEWKNEWIQIRVSKIEWFYVSKETKGHSGRPVRFWNNLIQFSMQYITTIRISRSQMFFEIGVLKLYNIHRNMPVLESLFSKAASLEAYKFIKKRLQHRCFPVNIANFLRKLFLKHTTDGCFCTWNSPGIHREIDDIYWVGR